MGLRIGLLALILLFINPFLLYFTAKFVPQLSPELCKLGSSTMVYICRMSDCMVGLRLRVMAFFSIFIHFSFPILHVNIKNLCRSFLRKF